MNKCTTVSNQNICPDCGGNTRFQRWCPYCYDKSLADISTYIPGVDPGALANDPEETTEYDLGLEIPEDVQAVIGALQMLIRKLETYRASNVYEAMDYLGGIELSIVQDTISLARFYDAVIL